MANVIKPKRTTVAGRVPTTANIAVGEIALNMADSILYFRDTSDNIKSVSSGLATVGTAGTYTKVTTDAFGRVTAGTTLSSGDIPTLNQNTTGSAGSVVNSFTIKADSGTTEGTSLYTFNGSSAKSLNFVAGTNVSIAKTAGTLTISANDTSVAWSEITSKPTTLSGYGITDAATSTHNHTGVYQPLDTDLTAIAGLTGTSGILKKTAADTWTLDTTAYTTNTGTVTSVSATAGTGITISGSPITTSGTLTITNSAPNVTTDITTTHNASTVVVNSSDGADGTINAATTSLAGVMSSADKTKLDGIATGATANTGTVTSVSTSGAITGGTITTTGTISHSTADGYLHIPATGTTNNGKVLTAGATAGSVSWVTPTTGTVTSVVGGSYLTGGTITTSGTLAVDATSANTVSKVVARDASGNFSAGTITASLSGNATTATTATTATKLGSTTIGSSTLPMYLNAGTATACSTTLGVSITGSSASCTGNSATATKLTTARTINGVSFDGTANITITASESTTITEW